MATRRKKNGQPEAVGAAEPATPLINGDVMPAPPAPPAPRRRAPARKKPPEDMTVVAVASMPAPVSPELTQQAERQVQEACEMAEGLRERLREAEAQAHGVVVQINRARDQAEEAARLHREAEARARQAEREAEHALQAAREATRRLREAEAEHEAAWSRVRRDLADEVRLVRQAAHAPAAPEPAPEPAPAPEQQPPAEPPVAAEAPLGPAVELVPDDDLAKGEVLLRAAVRSEAPGERLIRHIQQVLSVKAASRDILNEAAESSFDRAIARPLREHGDLTEEQRQALEARLRALGGEPAGNGKGLFGRLIGWATEAWAREPDDLDRTVHGVWKAMAGQALEMSMSQWLAPLARAMGDGETARLAERHWRQKENALDELRPFLVPLAELAAQLNEVARVARQPLKVEAEVAPEEEAGVRG